LGPFDTSESGYVAATFLATLLLDTLPFSSVRRRSTDGLSIRQSLTSLHWHLCQVAVTQDMLDPSWQVAIDAISKRDKARSSPRHADTFAIAS
jgi:hypothetical protein